MYANSETVEVYDDVNSGGEGGLLQGELLVRSPSVFQEYLNNPKATKETFHEGGIMLLLVLLLLQLLRFRQCCCFVALGL